MRVRTFLWALHVALYIALGLAIAHSQNSPPAAKPVELTVDRVFTELKSTELGACQLDLATQKAFIKVQQENWKTERDGLTLKVRELEKEKTALEAKLASAK